VIQSDTEYPESLRQIYDPPIALYVKGSLSAKDKNSIAMVGSRMTTHYGIETARKLAYQLAYLGITVVSGGARGIDTAAHQGALEVTGESGEESGKASGGLTVAVVGTGLETTYPKEHKKLEDEIAGSGAVISEFPLGTPPLPWQVASRFEMAYMPELFLWYALALLFPLGCLLAFRRDARIP